MYDEVPKYLEALMSDPDARRFWNGVAPAVSLLQGRPAELADICISARKRRVEIVGEARLSSTGKDQDLTASRAEALQAIDKLWDEAQSDYDTIEKAIARATETAPPSDPSAALLAEMQLQRAWTRAKAALDAVDGDTGALVRTAQGIATTAAADRDRPLLSALAEELPSYLRLHQLGGAASMILHQVDEATAPWQPARARAAKLLDQQLQVGWNRVQGAFGAARHDVASDNSSTILPGWLPTETFRF